MWSLSLRSYLSNVNPMYATYVQYGPVFEPCEKKNQRLKAKSLNNKIHCQRIFANLIFLVSCNVTIFHLSLFPYLHQFNYSIADSCILRNNIWTSGSKHIAATCRLEPDPNRQLMIVTHHITATHPEYDDLR